MSFSFPMWSTLWAGEENGPDETPVVVKDISGNEEEPSSSSDEGSFNSEGQDYVHPAIELSMTKSSERFEKTRRKTLIWMALCTSVVVLAMGVVVSVTSRKKNQRTVSSVVVVDDSAGKQNTMPSLSPTDAMGMESSIAVLPSDSPSTLAPTKAPRTKSSKKSTEFPSKMPSWPPTIFPTKSPSIPPTPTPSTIPPTTVPTLAPTEVPTTNLPSSTPFTNAPTGSDVKFEWPELVGMDAGKAGWKILSERPDITTIVYVLSISDSDESPRKDRVRIVRDPSNNTVAETPRVG